MTAPQNPTEIVVSAVYPDLTKIGQDGEREFLVSVRADRAFAIVHFPDKQAARDFRSQDRIEDILTEAFGVDHA